MRDYCFSHADLRLKPYRIYKRVGCFACALQKQQRRYVSHLEFCDARKEKLAREGKEYWKPVATREPAQPPPLPLLLPPGQPGTK